MDLKPLCRGKPLDRAARDKVRLNSEKWFWLDLLRCVSCMHLTLVVVTVVDVVRVIGWHHFSHQYVLPPMMLELGTKCPILASEDVRLARSLLLIDQCVGTKFSFLQGKHYG